MHPTPRQRQLRRRLTLRAGTGFAVLAALWLGAFFTCLAMLSALMAGGVPDHALPLLLAAAAACYRLGGWIHVPPPENGGIWLDEALIPGFRRRVDRICMRLGARRIDRILITPDTNAAVVCRPRFGLWGPMRTTLLLGIPLTHALNARQLCAVLAHELAHLAVQRNGHEAWRTHLRAWWLRCAERIEHERSLAALLVRPLLAPVAVRDLRDSVELSRLDEFEADAVAARIVGAAALAGALLELAMKDRFLHEDYWNKVMAQARDARRPRMRPFREMGLGVQVGFVRRDALARLDHLLRAKPDPLDTHPTLAERLRALHVGHLGGLPVDVDGPSAAQHYFERLLPTVSLVFDRMWWSESAREWRRTHRGAMSGH